MKHPIQNIATDSDGVVRFVPNPIVEFILAKGREHGIDLNTISAQGFSAEDQQQFAQLIGYSLSGYSELSYVTSEAYDTVRAMLQKGKTPEQARIKILENSLTKLRRALRKPMADLFDINPADLRGE